MLLKPQGFCPYITIYYLTSWGSPPPIQLACSSKLETVLDKSGVIISFLLWWTTWTWGAHNSSSNCRSLPCPHKLWLVWLGKAFARNDCLSGHISHFLLGLWQISNRWSKACTCKEWWCMMSREYTPHLSWLIALYCFLDYDLSARFIDTHWHCFCFRHISASFQW